MTKSMCEYQRSRMVPQCPVCKEGCRVIYRTVYGGRIIGCNRCIREGDAWMAPLDKTEVLVRDRRRRS